MVSQADVHARIKEARVAIYEVQRLLDVYLELGSRWEWRSVTDAVESYVKKHGLGGLD